MVFFVFCEFPTTNLATVSSATTIYIHSPEMTILYSTADCEKAIFRTKGLLPPAAKQHKHHSLTPEQGNDTAVNISVK